jgi:hypothetical protein
MPNRVASVVSPKSLAGATFVPRPAWPCFDTGGTPVPHRAYCQEALDAPHQSGLSSKALPDGDAATAIRYLDGE